MVDDDCYPLSEELTNDTHLVARGEGYGGEGVVGDVFEFEVTGVVHETDVDSALVGGVVVDYLQVPGFYFGLVGDVFHDRAVLDLADADDGRAEGCGLGLELRDGVGEVVYFEPVFASVPLALAFGSEFFVASEGVVGDGVEEVFEVVERNAGDLHLSARRGLSLEGSRC